MAVFLSSPVLALACRNRVLFSVLGESLYQLVHVSFLFSSFVIQLVKSCVFFVKVGKKRRRMFETGFSAVGIHDGVSFC